MKKFYLCLALLGACATASLAQKTPAGMKNVDRSGWKITAMNETPEGTEGPAPNGMALAAIDGNPATFYHSNWADNSGKTMPQAFQIELAETPQITAFGFLNRNNGNDQLTEWDIYFGDQPFDFSQLPEPSTGDTHGTFTASLDEKQHVFATPKQGKYVLLVARGSSSGSWLNCAEFYLYQAGDAASYTVKIVGQGSVVNVGGKAVADGETMTVGMDTDTKGVAADEKYAVATDVNGETKTLTYTVFVKDLAALSNDKKYFVTNAQAATRGSWYALDGKAELSTTAVEKAAANMEDAAQQFAFLKTSFGNTYLYHAATNKYVARNGKNAVMADVAGALELKPSQDANYPFTIAVEGWLLNCAPGRTVVTDWNIEDPGNRYRIIEVGAEDHATAMAALDAADQKPFSDAKAKGQAWVDNYKEVKGTDWSMTTESYDAIVAAVAATAPANKTESDEKVKAINDAIAAAKVQLPEEGLFTLAASNNADVKNQYLSAPTVEGNVVTSNGAVAGAADFWTIVPQEDGTVKIKNLYHDKFLPAMKQSANTMLADEGQAFKVTLVEKPGTVAFTDGTRFGAMHKAGREGGNLVGWESGSEASRWVVAPVEGVTITPSADLEGWATFAAPFATTIPADVKVYTAKVSQDKASLELMELTGAIPANTAVVVQSKAASQAITFAKTNQEVAAVADAFLKPALVATTAKTEGQKVYTLQKSEDMYGFYTNSEAARVGFSAYFELPETEGVQGLPFGKITAIKSAQTATDAATMFDLAGRRVNTAKGGLYIVNGKKVVLQ